MDRDQKTVWINYTNWKGKTGDRKIRPLSMWFGQTPYHPEQQWLLDAWDIEKNEQRTFAMKDIHSWKPEIENSGEFVAVWLQGEDDLRYQRFDNEKDAVGKAVYFGGIVVKGDVIVVDKSLLRDGQK